MAKRPTPAYLPPFPATRPSAGTLRSPPHLGRPVSLLPTFARPAPHQHQGRTPPPGPPPRRPRIGSPAAGGSPRLPIAANPLYHLHHPHPALAALPRGKTPRPAVARLPPHPRQHQQGRTPPPGPPPRSPPSYPGVNQETPHPAQNLCYPPAPARAISWPRPGPLPAPRPRRHLARVVSGTRPPCVRQLIWAGPHPGATRAAGSPRAGPSLPRTSPCTLCPYSCFGA